MSKLPGRRQGLGSTEAALSLLEGLTFDLEGVNKWEELFYILYKRCESAFVKRPTSALLVNTIRKLLIEAKKEFERQTDIDKAVNTLLEIISSQKNNTLKSIELLSEIGARRLPDNSVVLVHSYSTSVLKTLEKAHLQGKIKKVIVTESRPGSEGLVMAEKLDELGIQTVLIVDSAVNYVMRDVSIVLLGAEAITANGALVNKVGSSVISLIAYHKRKRNLVAAGSYKFSFETLFGELIKIPQATPDSIDFPQETFAGKVTTYLPIMDLTPPQYIDAIITEKGVTSPEGVPILLWEMYGHWPHYEPDIRNLLTEMREYAERKKS